MFEIVEYLCGVHSYVALSLFPAITLMISANYSFINAT